MKVTCSLFVLILLAVLAISAQIPRTISYQGILTDEKGNPKPDIIHNFAFSLYTGDGTKKWVEADTITTKNGMFSILLGLNTPLNIPFDQQYWLGIAVDGKELGQRIKLASVAYSLRADTANIAKYSVLGKKADTAGYSYYADSSSKTNYANYAVESNASKTSDKAIKSDSAGFAIKAVNSDTAKVALTVNGSVIANGSVDSSKIRNGSIARGKVVNDFKAPYSDTADVAKFVNENSIAVNSIDSSKIKSGSIIRSNVVAQFKAPYADTADVAVKAIKADTASIAKVIGMQDSINARTIVTSGNVGIGTAIPGAKLDVRGSFQIANTDYVPGSTGSVLTFGFGAASGNTYASFDNYTNGGTAFGNIVFHPTSNGNVGIGTASPTQKLCIFDNSQSIIKITGSTGSSYYGVNAGAAYLTTETNIPFAFYTNQTERMRIDNVGNVGIGTTNPQAKLHVVGDAMFENSTGGGNAWAQMKVPGRSWLVGTRGDENGNFTIFDNTASLDRFSINTDGNVGIGTTNPECPLHVRGAPSSEGVIMVQGNASAMQHKDHAGNLRFLTGLRSDLSPSLDYIFHSYGGNWLFWTGNVGILTPAPQYALDVNGTVRALSFIPPSDIRWKKNIVSLDSSLLKVTKLNGVTYEWRQSEFPTKNFPTGKQIGLIAQDVEKVIPELVNTDNEGYKSLSYDKLTAVLVEAVKEQQKQINVYKEQLRSQQEQIDKLKSFVGMK